MKRYRTSFGDDINIRKNINVKPGHSRSVAECFPDIDIKWSESALYWYYSEKLVYYEWSHGSWRMFSDGIKECKRDYIKLALARSPNLINVHRNMIVQLLRDRSYRTDVKLHIHSTLLRKNSGRLPRFQFNGPYMSLTESGHYNLTKLALHNPSGAFTIPTKHEHKILQMIIQSDRGDFLKEAFNRNSEFKKILESRGRICKSLRKLYSCADEMLAHIPKYIKIAAAMGSYSVLECLLQLINLDNTSMFECLYYVLHTPVRNFDKVLDVLGDHIDVEMVPVDVIRNFTIYILSIWKTTFRRQRRRLAISRNFGLL